MTLCIIGLGYVGLPLSLAFGKIHKVIGYDSSSKRVRELNNSNDKNGEFSKKSLNNKKNIKFTDKIPDIKEANI